MENLRGIIIRCHPIHPKRQPITEQILGFQSRPV